MTVPAKTTTAGELAESVWIQGDLSKLTPEQRAYHYREVCDSLGLNHKTRPFDYIVLNGRLTLYALRACTDQLRAIKGVSLEIVSRDVADDILTVHVRARMPDGRVDEDLGSVPFPSTLKGEARANAELKCITKAKRRATLSICGLGWLDETEVESIPASAKRPAPPASIELAKPANHDPQTGEAREPYALKTPETGDGRGWIAFGEQLIARVRDDRYRAIDWLGENARNVEIMKTAAPKVYERMHSAITGIMNEVGGNEAA